MTPPEESEGDGEVEWGGGWGGEKKKWGGDGGERKVKRVAMDQCMRSVGYLKRKEEKVEGVKFFICKGKCALFLKKEKKLNDEERR